MSQESYIQYLGGYSKENVTIDDIKTALIDLQAMDDEHGAFWVSVIKQEGNVLETHKDLSVTAIFEDKPEDEMRKQCKDLQEIQGLYLLLLNENFEELKLQFVSS